MLRFALYNGLYFGRSASEIRKRKKRTLNCIIDLSLLFLHADILEGPDQQPLPPKKRPHYDWVGVQGAMVQHIVLEELHTLHSPKQIFNTCLFDFHQRPRLLSISYLLLAFNANA